MASFTTKSVVCGAPLAKKSPVHPAVARSSTIVRASGDDTSRRSFLSVFGASAVLLINRGAEAIDIFDDRKAKDTGYNLIYEARDLELPQNVRDGIDQFKGDLAGTKKRAASAIARLKTELPSKIEKSYWTQGREELRLELGTLRFDLNTIASSLGDKTAKKSARAANDNFFVTVEVLDGAMRSKDQAAAEKALGKTIAALDSINIG
eukprot:g515.t1